MGANPEGLEEAESTPPPPGTNKVEIAVGGRTVVVESADPLADVVGYALSIFEQTAEPARQIPLGFDTTAGQFERAEPYAEPSGLEQWGNEDARRLGRHERHSSQDGFTRRLGVADPTGGHRTRLRPMPVGRGRAAVPAPRN